MGVINGLMDWYLIGEEEGVIRKQWSIFSGRHTGNSNLAHQQQTKE